MSTRPYFKHSGMTIAQSAPAANGSSKIFSKPVAADLVGAQAAEGDIYRAIKNMDASVTMYFREATGASSSNGFPLKPGETFVLLGPSGAGWVGDLYVAGDGTAKLAAISW